MDSADAYNDRRFLLSELLVLSTKTDIYTALAQAFADGYAAASEDMY